jgi:integrase
LPEEEPRLKSVLTGQRSHLADLVPVAIGTGLRKNEQLALQVQHIDFVRNLIMVTGTKTRKNREVPIQIEFAREQAARGSSGVERIRRKRIAVETRPFEASPVCTRRERRARCQDVLLEYLNP